MGELLPRCREAFTLTRDRHLSYAEAAAVLRVSPKTVEADWYMARAWLRAELRKRGLAPS